jgi:hypothetical protein
MRRGLILLISSAFALTGCGRSTPRFHLFASQDASDGSAGGDGSLGNDGSFDNDGATGDGPFNPDGEVFTDGGGSDGPVDGGAICAELQACCQSMGPGRRQMRCEMTAMSGDDRACAMALDTYVSRMQCSPPDGGLPDVGPADLGVPDSGGIGPECLALAQCCPNLPPMAQQACDVAVQSHNENFCQGLLMRLEGAGQCMPTDGGLPDGGIPDSGMIGPECIALDQCCQNVPPRFQMQCIAVVDSHNEALCQAVDNQLTMAGLCGGGGPDAGGLGPECTALEQCCQNAPPQFQAQCMQIAMGGNEATCQQILNLAGGFCMAPDAGPMGGDAGAIGPECMALEGCCQNAPPQFQMQCLAIAMGGNEMTCQTILNTIGGICMRPPPPDASVRDATVRDATVRDVGAPDTLNLDGGLGPECTALEGCCPNVPPQLQNFCLTTASNGNENLCQMTLGFARQGGFCM